MYTYTYYIYIYIHIQSTIISEALYEEFNGQGILSCLKGNLSYSSQPSLKPAQ